MSLQLHQRLSELIYIIFFSRLGLFMYILVCLAKQSGSAYIESFFFFFKKFKLSSYINRS